MPIKLFAFLLRFSGKIEIARGMRTFIAMAVPIALGLIFQQEAVGLKIALFAQMMLIADVGGLYQKRATTLIFTTLGVSLALLLGTLVSGSLGWTLLFIFIGLFIAGYLTIYGENGALAGVVLGFALLLAVTLPTDSINESLTHSFLGLLGGIWAIFLALFVWPFKPNQPLRQVVARNFQGIAQHLHQVTIFNPTPENIDLSLVQVRSLLLQSREMLTYNRLGGLGYNELRELLIVLIEDSDRIMTILIAMREIVRLHPLPQLATVQILMEDVLKQVALICEDISQLILGRNKKPDCDRLQLLILALQQQQELQQQTLTLEVDDYTSWITVEQLNTWLEKLKSQLQRTTETAQQLQNGEIRRPLGDRPSTFKKRSVRSFEPQKPSLTFWQQGWEPIYENFNIESPLFRHALRLSVGSVLGVLIYTSLSIAQGFWIGLTLLVVLKPDFSLTFQRFFSRILGTILGIGAVYLIFLTVHSLIWLEVLGVTSMAIAMALLRFHYSLSVFFITTFALISYQVSEPNSGGNGIAARLFCTLIGAALAFILSFGFLRQKEESVFSTVAVTSLDKINRYFQAVMTVFLGNKIYEEEELYLRRYKSRIANNDLQTSLERLIEDPSTPFSKKEPAITIANYLPRLGRGVTILVTELESYKGTEPHPNIAVFTEQVKEALDILSQALQHDLIPSSLPPLNKTIATIVSHLQLLQKARLTELSNNQEGPQLRSYLEDYSLVIIELQEIVRRIETLHAAIARFETQT
ncbi:MAG: FUSC family protein [Microcystaceae cyanobacterium]